MECHTNGIDTLNLVPKHCLQQVDPEHFELLHPQLSRLYEFFLYVFAKIFDLGTIFGTDDKQSKILLHILDGVISYVLRS